MRTKKEKFGQEKTGWQRQKWTRRRIIRTWPNTANRIQLASTRLVENCKKKRPENRTITLACCWGAPLKEERRIERAHDDGKIRWMFRAGFLRFFFLLLFLGREIESRPWRVTDATGDNSKTPRTANGVFWLLKFFFVSQFSRAVAFDRSLSQADAVEEKTEKKTKEERTPRSEKPGPTSRVDQWMESTRSDMGGSRDRCRLTGHAVRQRRIEWGSFSFRRCCLSWSFLFSLLVSLSFSSPVTDRCWCVCVSIQVTLMRDYRVVLYRDFLFFSRQNGDQEVLGTRENDPSCLLLIGSGRKRLNFLRVRRICGWRRPSSRNANGFFCLLSQPLLVGQITGFPIAQRVHVWRDRHRSRNPVTKSARGAWRWIESSLILIAFLQETYPD